uniref:Kinesin motor domain-containing protein n=1 Tax=Chromera velia CCMP2878 TaxID=1169474 RepID=A0A0G4GA67_9ALVE|eukprot:Cvel_4380.t1-p1 / transcript=Cvel_4380.t1 / gene=Cvel_4380 / organism=Chromera_velia_CCMP2878 / gene_product=Kinesin heavy chain, putative / transcript_product=Kinesin heavy chain, putative / location=Cvel_scaffold190:14485-20825(+) / protein_length=721 / sequence_SO=supercontig / SO=protein_coding / is_pseudo=false
MSGLFTEDALGFEDPPKLSQQLTVSSTTQETRSEEQAASSSSSSSSSSESAPQNSPSLPASLNASAAAASVLPVTHTKPPKPSKGCSVVVRIRPETPQEVAQGGEIAAWIGEDVGRVVTSDERGLKTYHFDRGFDQDTGQGELYENTAASLVDPLLEGYNVSIIGYGQTGAGKTHSLLGAENVSAKNKWKFALQDKATMGIAPRLLFDLFRSIGWASDGLLFDVHASFVEIFNEQLIDLLNPDAKALGEGGHPMVPSEPLKDAADRGRGMGEKVVKGPGPGAHMDMWTTPDGTIVTNATDVTVETAEEALEVLRRGVEKRQVAATRCNDRSSRSHAVFILTIRRQDLVSCTCNTAQLYIADLAGSEKLSKTGVADDETNNSGAPGEKEKEKGITEHEKEKEKQKRMREMANINRSLLTLGSVVKALSAMGHNGGGTAGGPATQVHIPYRQSKLTRLLENALGGNSYTLLLLCCSPHSVNLRETLSTLRFGDRASRIHNAPVKNEGVGVEELRKQLQREQLGRRAALAENRRLVVENSRQRSLLQQLIPLIALEHIEALKKSGALAALEGSIEGGRLSQEGGKATLVGLPVGVAVRMSGFLEAGALLRLSKVCRKYHESLRDSRHDEEVWTGACRVFWESGAETEVEKQRFIAQHMKLGGIFRYRHFAIFKAKAALYARRQALDSALAERQAGALLLVPSSKAGGCSGTGGAGSFSFAPPPR